MNKLRKFLVVGVMVLSVIAMSGIVVAPANAAASAGDLIKMAGLSSVYYLGNDGKRYVFPNESTYFSWYPDFSGVVTIPATELQSYPLGGNVTMRAGTKLVKITTDPSVYAVEPNGVLRKIQNEAQASALYGINWNKRIVDLSDAFFTNYTIGTALTDGQIPVGSLVKNAGNAAVYYYDGSNYRAVSNEAALAANRLWLYNILTVTNTLTSGGTPLTGVEAALINVAQNGGTGPVITGSGLMVSLSSMTPASTGIPAGSPVDFLKMNLTAANDGAVNVNSIKLTSYDLGSAVNIDNVTFYDNGVKVGSAKDFNSDKVATFNFATPINIPAGTTKTLTIKATIAAGQSGNYAIGVAAASDILATSASVTGSFPIRSNQMSVVSGTNIGTVTLNAVTDNDVSANFGEDNILMAGFDLTANNEPVLIQSLRFKNGGTNVADIISNLKLYIDGTEVATGVYADNYVTFTLSNYRIAKSDTVSLEVKGDVGVTSVNDTVVLYVKDVNDFSFLGQDYGFPVQLTDAGFQAINTTATDAEVSTITLASGDFTIDMDKSSAGTPAKDVKAGDNDVVLATLTFKSNGENATIEQIVDSGGSDFEIQGTGLAAGEIENVEMVDVATGGVYDITATRVDDTQWTLSMTDEISLVQGVAKKFLIRADMSDTVGAVIDNNDTIKVVLDGAAMTIRGDVSDATITNITPSSVTSATVTIKDASLTWTPVALTTTTVVGGATEVIVYQAKVKAGTSDAVKIQSLKLSTTANTATQFADANITKLDLYLNGKLLKSVSNDIVEAVNGVSVGTITFNSLDTANYTVAAGTEVDLVVKATFASTVSAGAFTLQTAVTGDVTARSVTGNKTVTASDPVGGSRIVNIAANGTLKVELLTSDTKADENSYLLAGSETAANRYLGELKFTTANEPVKVTRLSLVDNGTVTNADLSTIKLVKMVSGVPTIVASQLVAANGDVVFDPFDVTFPADQATSLFIVAVAKSMNAEGDVSGTATYGRTVWYNIDPAADGIVADGVNSGADVTLVVDADAGTVGTGEWAAASIKSKSNTITGSILNAITNNMADGLLSGGTSKTIAKYKFVFDNGSNRDASNNEMKAVFDKLILTFAKSTGVAITNVRAHIDGTATKVAADTEATLTAGNTAGTATWNAGTLAGLSGVGAVDGEVTLVITADVAPSATVDEYNQTSIADLNGTGGDDFNYLGAGTGSAALTNMYLSVTEVLGATLQE